MNALIEKISKLTTAQVKDIAAKLAVDFQDGADEVFSACLNELERRMSEGDFVAFCEDL